MKRLYKYIVVLAIILFIIIVCISKDNRKKIVKGYSVKNPTFSQEDNWGEEVFANIPFDICSENVFTDIDVKKVSLNDKIINILVGNSKKGTGFYFYGVPAIEKLNSNKWERLTYKESDPSREQWCVCAIEDAEDICFSTNISVDIDNINDFTEGSYRAVVFLTDRNIYVPFEVIGDK